MPTPPHIKQNQQSASKTITHNIYINIVIKNQIKMGNHHSTSKKTYNLNKKDTNKQQKNNQILLEEFTQKIKNMETFSEEEIQTMNEMSEEDRMKFFLAYNEIIDYVNHIISHDKFDTY